MNLKKMITQPLKTTMLFAIATALFVRCSEQPLELAVPETTATEAFTIEEKEVLYQAFNLTLATEEYFYNQTQKGRVDETSASGLALFILVDVCDIECEENDYKCLLQYYYKCHSTTATLSYKSSDPEPLPDASDSISAFANNIMIAIYTKSPEAAGFELTTEEGELFGYGNGRDSDFSYDERTRLAIFPIQVVNEKLAERPLFIRIKTTIETLEGEDLAVQLNHSFGLQLIVD